MKWLRWSFLVGFLFSIWECFYKIPFSQDVVAFILPEVSLTTSVVRDDISQIGAVMDVRADYVQTEHNFSQYHDLDFGQEDQVLRIFEEEVSQASKILVNREPLWNYKKATIKIDKPVVWPRKLLKPIKISTENSSAITEELQF